jgi:hypothetical protein
VCTSETLAPAGARNLKSFQFFGVNANASDAAVSTLSKTGNHQYYFRGQKYWTGNYNGAPKLINGNIASNAKYLKGAGKLLGFAGTAITLYQSVDEFRNGRNVAGGARLAVAGVATAAAFIPGVGWGITLGIGLADAIWGDDFYNYLEEEFGN